MSSPHRVQVGTAEEPLYFQATDGGYHGDLPPYHDVASISAARQLERAAGLIRCEVLHLLDTKPHQFQPTFTPCGYRDEQWRSINLTTDGFRYHANRALLPRTTAIVDSIPGLTFAQVGVLEPGCELMEHHGDTNAMYRLHLALDIPAPYPAVGISVAGEQRGWVEGEVLAFEDAHLHWVWNHSNRRRIVLVADVVKDELSDRAPALRAQAGAGILVQMLHSRVPVTRRLSRRVNRALLIGLAGVVRLLLPLQRHRPTLRAHSDPPTEDS